jgi:hypothetical protein
MSFGFYRSALVRSLFLLVSLALLGGCAGYAIDYVKPKGEIVGAELTRYGLDAAQSACVNERLGAALNPWQLRQLQKAASGVTRGYADPGRLQMSDLLWVSRHVDDPKVALELGVAANACGLGAANVATARIPATAAPVGTGIVAAAPSNAPVVTLPPAPGGPAAAPPRAIAAPGAWVNLGAAATGQAIAIDAASLDRTSAPQPQAWFRVTNPGQTGPSESSYLLRVDCAGRTINPMAIRKHDAAGAVTEQRDYGAGGEGALPIEAGTVMEVAYRAVCT